MSSAKDAERTVRCPACAGPARYTTENPWRPFCSQRCREGDLGAWASERYRVAERPGQSPGADEDGAGGGTPPAPH